MPENEDTSILRKEAMTVNGIRAIVFDTFGTVADWRSSITSDFRAFGKHKSIDAPWEVIVDEWKTAYKPGMNAVRSGAWPWTKVDAIYRSQLEAILPKYGITMLTEDEKAYLNRAWHRLKPWQDSVAGLTRLKQRFVISTLSNGDVECLVDMAKNAGLPWDVILCAELFRHYKPDPEVYLGALTLLNREPHEVMLVAAHNYDLHAARSHGMRTGFVPRPTEYGPSQKTDLEAEEDWDVVVNDFGELADVLGC
jgi:2-haloacid dehalogenase